MAIRSETRKVYRDEHGRFVAAPRTPMCKRRPLDAIALFVAVRALRRRRYLGWLVALLAATLVGCDVEIGSPHNPPCEKCRDGKCPTVRFSTEAAMDAPDGLCPFRTVPPVDLPTSLREPNYAGGSCMWASLISVLRSQHQTELADYVRANYSGRAGVQHCMQLAEKLGIRYAYTDSGDEAFLEWCSRTRRAAAIYYGSDHAQTFMGYNATGEAVVLDNNEVEQYHIIPKSTFLAEWHAEGGHAITTVYASNPRRPYYIGEAD